VIVIREGDTGFKIETWLYEALVCLSGAGGFECGLAVYGFMPVKAEIVS
jgi:hypothetical protein